MSLLSSPTRLSSPAGDALTPRSKIQALVSRIEEDSDNDASRSPSRPARVPLQPLDANRGMNMPLQPKLKPNVSYNGAPFTEEFTSSTRNNPIEDAASKAQTADAFNDSDGSVSDDYNGTSAYQRIRAQMLNKKSEPTTRHVAGGTQALSENDTSEDEDDEIIPRGRMAARLQSKNARSVEVVLDQIGSDSDHAGPQAETFLRPTQNSPIQPSSPPSGTSPMKRKRLWLRKKAQPNLPDDSLTAPPSREAAEEEDDDKLDMLSSDAPNSRLAALVAKKREERAAREAEEEERRRQRLERLAQEIANVDKPKLPKKNKGKRVEKQAASEESEEDDLLSSQVLTQSSRPARKASKKALEEMSKEQQRISRNMQLAHEARTKKKISKDSLLQRFNFRVTAPEIAPAPISSSSAPPSDDEHERDHHTPPTSPVSTSEGKGKAIDSGALNLEAQEQSVDLQVNRTAISPQKGSLRVGDDHHQPAKNFMASIPERSLADASKDVEVSPTIAQASSKPSSKALAKTAALKNYVHSRRRDADSDSDLEVVPKERSALLATFERVQPFSSRGVEGKAMKTLRTLAHITSPDSKKNTSMTPAALQASLKKKARLQAAQERAEKIQDLRDRGVIVRTDEERQKDQAEFEDMLEKARLENEELAKKEKSEAKKEAKENGEDLPSSDDEDEYQIDEEQDELALSGSEDEEDEGDESENEEGENVAEDEEGAEDLVRESFLDEQAADASETDEEDREGVEAIAAGSEDELAIRPRKARRVTRIIDDDDEDDVQDDRPPTPTQKAAAATSANPFGAADFVRTSPVNPFAAAAGAAPMGLTQAFAATMSNSQDLETLPFEQDSLAHLEPVPDPDFLGIEVDSAPQATQQDSGLQLELHLSQSQIQYDTMAVPELTQSDMPEPTQDMGFGMSSPIGDRFANAPPSTIDTLPASVSPVAQRKGRLQRGLKQVFSDEELADDEQESDAEYVDSADAFNRMKRAAKSLAKAKAEEAFNKKKSEAKEMVEEQAQESEDEYAGIGGASDDESDGEMDEAVKQMIDEGKVDVDERQLAAFHANKERADDEKAVEKLFKDINNGGLRRKRHAEFDLSESDDDLEDRRRRKRAEFARMRKALLADEKVGKIAEDPKKMAFLRAIEDREEGEYEDVMEEEPQQEQDGEVEDEQQQVPDSQAEQPDTSAAPAIAGVVAATGTKRKRPLATISSNPRRRGHLPSKPLTLAEIRASVSFLTEDPREFDANTHGWSDAGSDADVEDQPVQWSTYARRTSATTVVDRISLRRDESMNAATSSSTRMAFQAESTVTPGFRVPSLLRRATTGLSAFSDTSSTSGRASDGSYGSRGVGSASSSRSNSIHGAVSLTAETVRKGGASMKCSVNYVAREAVRRTQIDGVEQRRRDGILKRKREDSGGLGKMFGAGKWE